MYIKKILLIIALLGVLVMGGFAYYVYANIFSPNTTFTNNQAQVYIPTGASFADVVEELRPLLDNMTSFKAVAQRKGYTTNVRAGHFILTPGMNNNEIINEIRSANTPIQVKFNNRERIENLAGQLAHQLEADSLTFLQAMKDPEFLRSAGLTEASALSIYIPNTYEVYWNTSAIDFRNRMLKEYEAFWKGPRAAKAEALGMSWNEVISLAAIVQKETAKVDERPRVAGLYVNRLQQGMPLQADPTVIYAKKHTENDFDQVIKRVLFRDLEIESPYNTYKNPGVPPGPITMPDISSIDGVLNREKHKYLYMVVNIDNFGYHKFAESLAQHNRNRAEYVRWINAQGINR